MTDLVLGLIVGGILAFVIAGIGSWLYVRRVGWSHGQRVSGFETTLLELRQEAAEDKETNRRLRHELAVTTPGHLLETATLAEMDRDGAISERDQAIEQLELVQRDLAGAKTRLADQEAKLRQYREALQEIRMSLEAQGRSRAGLASASMLDTAELTGHDPSSLAQEDESHDEGDDEHREPEDLSPETADLGVGD